MMNGKKIFVAVLSLLCAHGAMADNWLANINDNVLVNRITLPGSHDAGTGDGFVTISGEREAKTQDLSISAQWDAGVRAFDLRPTVKKGDKGLFLQIFHAKHETLISFDEVLRTLKKKLRENPSEFALILMKHEDAVYKDLQYMWNDVMNECIHSDEWADCMVTFRPNMTLADVRGKILVFSRMRYGANSVGAFVDNWGDHSTIRDEQEGIIRGDGEESLALQDFYNCVEEGRTDTKRQAIIEMFDYARALAPADRQWVITHTSGFTVPGGTDGIKNVANITNKLAADYLERAENTGFCGIVMMDFAGKDMVTGTKVYGQRLLNAVIQQNFKTSAIDTK